MPADTEINDELIAERRQGGRRVNARRHGAVGGASGVAD